MPADKWHKECLNFEYCWQQFKQNDFTQMTECDTKDLCIKPEALASARDVLQQFSLDSWIGELMHIYGYLPVPKIGITFNPFPKKITIKIGGQEQSKAASPKPVIIPKRNEITVKQVPVQQNVQSAQQTVNMLQQMSDFAALSINPTPDTNVPNLITGPNNNTNDLQDFINL